MVATVNFAYRDSTTSSAWTTLSTTLRFKAADNNNTGAPTDDPLVRPSSGTNYSYWKNLRCRVVTRAAVALLNLRVKSTANTILLGGGDSAVDLKYNFRLASNVISNANTVLPGVAGELTTTEVQWLAGRTAGSTSDGSNVANHVTTSQSDGDFWAGSTGSDQLLLSLEVGSANSAGGTLTPFNLVLVYNEI